MGTVDLIWQGPEKEDDRVQQIQLVQNAIAAKVDGIVLAPLDSGRWSSRSRRRSPRAFPVVIIDSGLDSQGHLQLRRDEQL